jgi:hypothetical protein
MRDAGVLVMGVRVLVDVEVALELEVLVGQEGPVRARRDLHLVDVVQRVREHAHELGERDGAPLVEAQQLAVVHALARAVLAAAEVQDEQVVALQVRQPVQVAVLVAQLEVGDGRAGLEVPAHGRSLVVGGEGQRRCAPEAASRMR